jgi:hypothetical protein
MFSFLRSLHIVFKLVVLAYISPQQRMRVPFSPHTRQHLLLEVFLMITILTGVRWNLSVVLVCIYFIARDGENFFHVFWPFQFLPMKKFVLVQLLTSLLVH